MFDNSDNVLDLSNTDNNSLNEFSKIIQNFNKINIKEMEPTIKNFNKNVIEENLNNVIDKLVDLIFEELNKGKEANVIKQQVLDYIYNQMIFKQQIYNWLIENQNDSNSIYLLGYFNYYGIETKFNEHRAIELYKRAAELENKVAQLCLAEIYIEIDGNLSFKLSNKLANKEYAFGINNLGICYENGIGTNVNEEKAFEMYQKAADLGNVSGINNLSWCYYEGIGTDTNKQKVFELYQKAADLESLDGINSLGWCYEKGIGTNIDKQKAFELYQKAENLEAQLFWLNV
ncbi:uncharacterized protein OCT59_023634 [Rhizophagus irregularis]|uniref:Sel1 repeat domain-containing protein n=2 Tax=Rhizophagus irregularis TaxID=588596 RepID=A0A015I0Y7_RHIIW|nr:hypothetical protein RirG_269310 [Rhizophagus irregularis DAOM 197198w]UZO03226.1 hypothetical protein OCT59_023634 [Rhizophagus irregularis]